MTFVILNACNEKDQFGESMTALADKLNAEGHQVKLHHLCESHVIPCTGCWGCWVKLPGNCVFDDDTHQIRKDCIKADRLIFASPLIMGFTSAKLKHVQDKLIPLLHPYISIRQGECHHKKRYEAYPDIAVIYQAENDTDQEDIAILKKAYQRLALNFWADLLFVEELTEDSEQIYHKMISQK